MIDPKNRFMLGIATVALVVAAGSISARADDAMLREVLQRLDKLERENAKLRAKVDKQETSSKPKNSDDSHHNQAAAVPAGSAPAAASPAAYAAPPIASNDGWYIQKKDGPGLTFLTPGGEIGMYGQFDVSVDATTKGLEHKIGNPGDSPVGNVGWLPAISSNLSYIGIRGFQNISETDFRFVYQMETLIDVAVNAGTAESNSNKSNVVKGALTTRDSFVGVDNKEWGSLKVGKTEAPYKKSTDVFNPFNGMLGDYRVVMGNTGGDNRVEFMTRMEHSLWWESPDWNGLKLAALYSPGQNRANNSDNIAQGVSDCAGGNNPNSGGFVSCSDGSFSDAISLSGTYKKGDFLITTAYERHEKVNRSSDILGIYADPTQPVPASLIARDVAAEDAFKVGALYKFPTKTTVGGIYESMRRYVPSDLKFQNDRQRNGTWLFVTQELTAKDEVSFGWAHAFQAQGDTGQHTFANLAAPGGQDGDVYAPNKNSADMLTAAYKHKFSPALTWYLNGAMTINDTTGHYDLGAGGHGVTTDCHDAATAIGGAGSNPHCWTGSTLLGVSTGLNYKF